MTFWRQMVLNRQRQSLLYWSPRLIWFKCYICMSRKSSVPPVYAVCRTKLSEGQARALRVFQAVSLAATSHDVTANLKEVQRVLPARYVRSDEQREEGEDFKYALTVQKWKRRWPEERLGSQGERKVVRKKWEVKAQDCEIALSVSFLMKCKR